MTRWLLALTWIAIIVYRIGFSDGKEVKVSAPEPSGYYLIEYRRKSISTFYVDTKTGATKSASLDEIEQNSGMKFPRFEDRNEN